MSVLDPFGKEAVMKTPIYAKQSGFMVHPVVSMVFCLVFFGCATAPAPTNEAKTQSMAATSLAAGGSALPASIGRKFEEMNEREQNAFFTEMKKQDFATIFQAMLDAGRIEHDQDKEGAIQFALIGAMQDRTPSPKFYAQLKAFIADDSNSIIERSAVLGVLALAESKESADALRDVVPGLKDKDLKDAAAGAIGMWAGSHDEHLAPALDRLWHESNDPQFITAASVPMAEIGAPSSVKLLLAAMLAPDGKDNVRKLAAQGALKNVYAKTAVPPLAAALASQPPASPQAALIFTMLTRVDDATGGQALITWLENADSSAAPLALHWFDHPKNPTHMRAATAALDPKVPFRSEANREALRTGLVANKASAIIAEFPVEAADLQLKFDDISARERRAILEELGKQDFATIFQAFVDADRIEHDRSKLEAIQLVLESAMKAKTPPPEFFAQIKAFISNDSNSKLTRNGLIGILWHAGGNGSAEALVYEATTLKDNDLKNLAITGIGLVGMQPDDEDLAPAINQLWLQSKDFFPLTYISIGMAEIGAPSSIKLLLSAALAPNGEDRPRKLAASDALRKVVSKNAVPALASALDSQPASSPLAALAFITLTQIHDPAITRILLTWLQNADRSAGTLIHNWLAHALTDDQLAAMTAALDPSLPFRYEDNRGSLRANLDAYKYRQQRALLKP